MSERETRGANEAIDFNDELRNRREKLAALRQQGVAFPNDFRRDHTSDQLHEEFDAKDNQELESLNIEVSVAGRMMTRRIMGKASFVVMFPVYHIFLQNRSAGLRRGLFCGILLLKKGLLREALLQGRRQSNGGQRTAGPAARAAACLV